MKLTKSRLKQIIREELNIVLESSPHRDIVAGQDDPSRYVTAHTLGRVDRYQSMAAAAARGNPRALNDLRRAAKTNPHAQALLDAVYEEKPGLNPANRLSPEEREYLDPKGYSDLTFVDDR